MEVGKICFGSEKFSFMKKNKGGTNKQQICHIIEITADAVPANAIYRFWINRPYSQKSELMCCERLRHSESDAIMLLLVVENEDNFRNLLPPSCLMSIDMFIALARGRVLPWLVILLELRFTVLYEIEIESQVF